MNWTHEKPGGAGGGLEMGNEEYPIVLRPSADVLGAIRLVAEEEGVPSEAIAEAALAHCARLNLFHSAIVKTLDDAQVWGA